MGSTSLRLALVLVAFGCGGSSDEAPINKPRGAAAYTGKRSVQTNGLGVAADGPLVAASDGSERSLARLFDDGPALVIFYRGHW